MVAGVREQITSEMRLLGCYYGLSWQPLCGSVVTVRSIDLNHCLERSTACPVFYLPAPSSAESPLVVGSSQPSPLVEDLVNPLGDPPISG